MVDGLPDSPDAPRPDIDDMSDEEFAAELDRRDAEFLQDLSVRTSWEELKRMSSGESSAHRYLRSP
jgi:hypothetical protein